MKNWIMYMRLRLVIVFALPVAVLLGEEKSDIAALLKAQLEQARGSAREPTVDIRITDGMLRAADPQQVLAILAPYEQDSEWPVRHMAHLIIVRVANIHPITQIRQEVARRLVEAEFNGTDRGTHKLLLNYTAKDFNEQSKALICKALGQQANIGRVGGDPSIWLCGIANLQDQLPRLKELLMDEVAYRTDRKTRHSTKWYYSSAWAARLARARMGIKQDIERCLALIQQEIDGNKNWRLLRHLGYIRQPEAIESLKGYFLSNLRLPRTNPGMEGEAYSHYLMPILEDNLLNWPVRSTPIQRSARVYSEEEIRLCKEWMSEQTEWKIRK